MLGADAALKDTTNTQVMKESAVLFAFLGWPEIVAILAILLVMAVAVGAVVLVVLLIVRATQKKSATPPQPAPPPIHTDRS